jgi:hypothetical protein
MSANLIAVLSILIVFGYPLFGAIGMLRLAVVTAWQKLLASRASRRLSRA